MRGNVIVRMRWLNWMVFDPLYIDNDGPVSKEEDVSSAPMLGRVEL